MAKNRHFSGFRPPIPTPNEGPDFCFAVVIKSGVVKLAAYRWFQKLDRQFSAIRDHLIFSPHLGLFKWRQGDPPYRESGCHIN